MRQSVSSVVSEKITTEKVRGSVGGVLGDVEQGAVNALAQGDVMALIRSLGDAGDKLIGIANDLGSGFVDGTKQIVQKMSASVLEQYKDVGGVKVGQSDVEKTLLGYLDELQNKTTTKETETSKTNSFNVNQNIDVKGTSDQITRENVFKWNDEWWSEVTKDPSKMNKAIEGIDKSMSGSGMAK
jgi:hypothetical protein